MAREFMEPFWKTEGTPLDGVGVGYCGGPTGATTPDETDTTNNNHHNSQQSGVHPTSTGSSSAATTTTTTTSNNMNNNNNTTTDMMDAMKRKWVLFQANLDTMLQGIGFPQPFNRRRTGEGSGGGGGPGTGGGDKEGTALTTTTATDEKKRHHNHSTSSNPNRANAHHHQQQLHHRTGEAGATNSSSSTSPSDAVVVVHQEHIEMALLSQGELRLGIGHDFILKQLSNPTWCDKCGDFIWGVYKQCLKCRRKFFPVFLKKKTTILFLFPIYPFSHPFSF